MKKAIRYVSLSLMFVLFFSTCISSSFAESSVSSIVPLNIAMYKNELYLTSSDLAAQGAYASALVAELKRAQVSQYGDIISNFCASHESPVYERVKESYEAGVSSLKATSYSVPDDFAEKYQKEYSISSGTQLVMTPTYIEVDTLSERNNSIVKVYGVKTMSTTSAKSATLSKTYYSYLGNKLFSTSLSCDFYYNGTKAWYMSGFDYSYTRGTLQPWKVSNWKGWKEASGTSYNAYCSGNFYCGIGWEGNEIIFQELYCKNKISCDKSGKITSSITH